MDLSLKSRVLGTIWGVCVADALGGPVQFMDPGTFPPVTDLAFVKPFNQPAGSYSDDGSMTLALAKSFIDSEGKYNHTLSIQYFLNWFVFGQFSTTDSAWDIGNATRVSLSQWLKYGTNNLHSTQQRVCEKLDREESSGNGSLMRISPVGVVLWKFSALARQAAREQSRVTHPARACVEACDAYTEVMCGVMSGKNKEQLCDIITQSQFTHPALVERLSKYKTVADWKAKSARDIRSSGWVVDTLEAALWGFFKYDSWASGALAVVNLGGDSDTAGAVYGGLAGCFYGYKSIPTDWADRMVNKGLIGDIAAKLSDVVSSMQ